MDEIIFQLDETTVPMDIIAKHFPYDELVNFVLQTTYVGNIKIGIKSEQTKAIQLEDKVR